MQRFFTALLWVAATAAFAVGPVPNSAQIYLESMTSPEVRDSVKAGTAKIDRKSVV